MVGETFSHYRILEPLAAGGMGEVFAAEDVRLGRKVAVKFLPEKLADDPERLARFEHEARTLARLNHRSIVTLHEVDSHEGRTFLVMELIDGQALSQLIPRGGLPVQRLLEIASAVADALVAIHEAGIVHRDLKPSNVLIDRNGTVKVCDVGIAVPLAEDAGSEESTATMTAVGSLVGTFAYMAPERIQGVRNDSRSDLFSFGVMLHEMAVGKRPFRGGSELGIASEILYRDPPSSGDARPDLPDDLGRIIQHCLQKDPDRRYQTAKGLRSELLELRQALYTETSDQTSSPGLGTGPRRTPTLVVQGLAALALASALWAGFLWWGHAAPDGGEPAFANDRVQALLDQATAYERRGDFRQDLEHARNVLQRALALEPENPYLQGRLAALLARIQVQFPVDGRPQEIRDLADAALERDPDLAAPWVARGRLALMSGTWQEAERAARRAIELEPDFTMAYGLLGESLLGQGRTDEAIEAASGALRIGRDELWGRLVLAKVLMNAGSYNEAASHYEKVLELAPDLPNARANLGVIYAWTGRHLEAVPLLRKALDEHPADALATNLGYALYGLQRYEEAGEAFRTAHELEPDVPGHERNLADVAEVLGDEERKRHWLQQALEDYDRALGTGGGPRMLAERAVAAAKLGHFDEAKSNVDDALEQSDSDPYILFFAAQVAALRGAQDELVLRMREAIDAGFPRDPFSSDLAFSDFREQVWFSELLLAPAGS